MDYIFVNDEEGFDFSSVYYNQTKDVHPPMYYWMVNVVCSIFRENSQVAAVQVMNIIIYIAALILLYKIADKLFKKQMIALCCVALYGFSTVGLSTALMIRMYVLLMFFTLLLVLLVIEYIQSEKWYLCVPIAVVICMGLMTQYYYVFYTFFLCVIVDIYLIHSKKYKMCLCFSMFALLGVFGMVLWYPTIINHLLADKLVSGGNAVENLVSISEYLFRIITYMKQVIFYQLLGPVCIAGGLSVILFKRYKLLKEVITRTKVTGLVMIIVIPAFLTALLVAIVSPVIAVRYIYNIMPIFGLAVGYLLYCVTETSQSGKRSMLVSVVSVMSIMLITICIVKPEYIYLEHREYNDICETYSEFPCVYMNDNANSTLTQDLLQLIKFNEVFVANDVKSPKLASYLLEIENKEKLILYINTDMFWTRGYDSEKVLGQMKECFGYKNYELLYGQGLSECYVLSK